MVDEGWEASLWFTEIMFASFKSSYLVRELHLDQCLLRTRVYLPEELLVLIVQKISCS